MDELVQVGGHEFKMTNLSKIFWPEDGFTKADLIKYYIDISKSILPHLKNRPLVMKRYPDGISGKSFYQKECPDYAPDWIETFAVPHTDKVINYIVCNEPSVLSWLANKGCVEIHAWLAKIENIDCPDIAVIDLDPGEGTEWNDILDIALLCRKALAEFGLSPCVKTSGSKGLHLFIPINNIYPYPAVTDAMHYIADLIVSVYPQKTTIERSVAKRKGKIYLDYLQNGRGKTMAFQYSLRPLPGAPVSTPLLWEEIEAKNVKPQFFNIRTIFERLDRYGDIMGGTLQKKDSLDKLMSIAGIKLQEKKTDKNFTSEQEIFA